MAAAAAAAAGGRGGEETNNIFPRSRRSARGGSARATTAMTLLGRRKLAASATGRTTVCAPSSQHLPALGCTPSFRELQRSCVYLQDLVEVATCTTGALQAQLEERTRQYERAAAGMDAMRQAAEMEREAAAAWRAERKSLLKLHAARSEEVATVRRGHEAVESQVLVVENVQLEQHVLLLAQERHMKEERAARVADAVGMRGLQREVRSLEAQLERAASEHTLQRQHIATLQQTYVHALRGACVSGVEPQRSADAGAPCRAREEARIASPTTHARGASLVPAVEIPETAPRGVGGEHHLPAEVLAGEEDPGALLMMWSNPEGWSRAAQRWR